MHYSISHDLSSVATSNYMDFRLNGVATEDLELYCIKAPLLSGYYRTSAHQFGTVLVQRLLLRLVSRKVDFLRVQEDCL